TFFQGRALPPAEDVRMVDASGTIQTVAGSGPFGSGGLGGPALSAQLAAPYSVAVGPDQSLLVGEVGLQRVLRFRSGGALDLVAGRALPVVGAYSGDGGPARTARLYGPEGLGEDADGKVFIADMRSRRIRVVDSLGSIVTIAGTGRSEVAYPGPASQADIGCPLGLAVGRDGRVYFPGSGSVLVLTPVPY